MKKLKQKLNSKRGVSIVMALLLALICLFAGAAALTAASANIGRYTYLRKEQQEYLSISSAARLLKTQFEQGNNISATCTDAAATITPNPTVGSNHVYSLLNSWMSDLLFNAYIKSDPGSSTAHSLSEQKFTVELKDDDKYPIVNVKVTSKSLEAASADIEVELSAGEGDKRKLKFTVSLTLTADTTAKTITVSEAKVDRITLPGEKEGTP